MVWKLKSYRRYTLFYSPKNSHNTDYSILVVHDDKLNKDWKLKFVKVHDPVRTFMREGKAIFFACTDFKSAESDDLLDIDFWMVHKGKVFEVIDTKIHKVNGEPRYTYEGTEIKEIR